ncbi:MAG: HNH endonuclease [Actinobacteria bacterium]|jgi:5-methylcytosine-specific restriction endonuclease McrA|nr:MAG: HNH endonuclease [Actinomycetota bacterium]
MAKALVLNATYEPLCVVPVRRAVVLVLKEKAEVLHATDAELHSERRAFAVPSVIRLTYFVKVPFRARAALSRRAVFVRDGHRCQYCGANAENIDHIVPRSRGGEHVWENVVAACRPCNTRKEDRLLHEVGFVLRRKPMAPRELTWVIVAVGTVHPHWEPYLQPGAALSA